MCHSITGSAIRRQSTALRQHRHLSGAVSTATSSRNRGRTRGSLRCTPVCAGKDVDFADRAVASLPYLVPLFDGLKYGRFLFAQFPALANLLSPLNPLISLYFSFPFASLIVFFAIYSGIVNNFQFSRFVRFNALQSILLDIILIVPGLIEQVIKPPMGGAGLTIYIQLYNSIFFFVFASVLYAVGSCLAGTVPRLPLVADAADQQVR
ncbi:g7624 [Coccomyxa viridis]|uniref:Protein TIC 20 n=1 Tax=Coccomyxa viridis TaxID=1274662 RepID=A0ABP1FYC2_9CHLO